MRPVHLSIEGLACFKERQEIDFSGLDLFAISGPTGAGKSTLLDAILFALYGEVPRVGKQDLKEMISAARERVSVQFDFAVGDGQYRIARALRRRGAATVRFEEHDGTDFNVLIADQVRTAAQEISRILGLDADAFTQAVILPQGEFARFLKADPRKRREMLRTLLRLDVYERMRQAAQEASNRNRHEHDALEQRLREEYEGVSSRALATLESNLQEAATNLEERREARRVAENLLVETRDRRARTVELAQNEARLSDLQRRSPEIEEARRELETARRAAGLVPLIEETDRAQQHASRARDEEERAREASEEAAQEHEERIRELERAEEQAQEIPALRGRVTRLDRILGRLPELRGLETAVNENRRRLDRLAHEVDGISELLGQLEEKVARLQSTISGAQAELDGIGYDAELDAALDRVRDMATRLTIKRGGLEEANREREQRRTTLDGLAAEVDRLRDVVGEIEESEQTAQRAADAAEEALHAAHHRDAANHLRESLVPGAPCPVCSQFVADPPLADLDPEVAAARVAHEDAGSTLRRIRDDMQETRGVLTQAESDVRAAQVAFAEVDTRVRAALAEVCQLETDIREELGGHAPLEVEEIEVWVAAQIQTVSAARSSFEEVRDRLQTAGRELSELRQSEETNRRELDRIQRERQERATDLRADEERLEIVRREIAEVTRSPDPEAEREDLVEKIADIESCRQNAVDGEGRSRSGLAAAREVLAERRRAAKEAENEALDRLRTRDEHIAQAGFETPDDVHEAERDGATQAELLGMVDTHERDLHAVDQRVGDLRNHLGGERVSAEQLEDAAGTARRITEEVEALVGENENLRQQIETMTDRLDRAQELRRQLRSVRENRRLFSGLATDLRSDRFQAYVLEEVFTELVNGASTRLLTLTGERYSLEFCEDEILVVDHDNAGETRISDTLSGGETFLTSLGLALELSNQIQRAEGAVRLDSLFIDEGFGTLDPDTLSVVSETIQTLQAGGRMVGIITHIPELRDEFSQQVLVTKHAGYSTVSVRE